MNDPPVADPRLAEAFRAWSESTGDGCSDEVRERIWQAVTGQLPPAERRSVVEMTATDPACAQAWHIAAELWRASEAAGGTVPSSHAASTPTTRDWTRRWAAAAAALFIATTLGAVWLVNRSPTDVYRATRGYVIQSLVADSVTLPRNMFRLRWTPGLEGTRYEVQVTTEDLRMLTTVSNLSVPEFVVPADRLAGVPPSSRVLWQVTAMLPDADRVTSQTFVTGVE